MYNNDPSQKILFIRDLFSACQLVAASLQFKKNPTSKHKIAAQLSKNKNLCVKNDKLSNVILKGNVKNTISFLFTDQLFK